MMRLDPYDLRSRIPRVPGIVDTTVWNQFGFFDARDYGAKYDAQYVKDGVTESGSAALACPVSNPFKPADAGKSIVIQGAGPGGGLLVTTIQSFTDAGTVTLADHANATFTLASGPTLVSWGTDDTAAWQSAIIDAKAIRGTLLGMPGRSLILNGLRIVDASFTFMGVSEIIPAIGYTIVEQDCFTLYCPTDHPILDWDISWDRTTGNPPNYAIGAGAVLKNVLLLGSFAGPNQHGIIAETKRLDMHGVYTNNTGGNGFMIRDQVGGLFTKCIAYDFQGDGWVFDDTPKPGELDNRACTVVSLVQCGALGGWQPGGSVPGATQSALVLRNGVTGCKFLEFDSENNNGYAIRIAGYSDYKTWGDDPAAAGFALLSPPASFSPRPARFNKFDQHWDEGNLKGTLDLGSRNGSRYNKIFFAHATSPQPKLDVYGEGNIVWRAREYYTSLKEDVNSSGLPQTVSVGSTSGASEQPQVAVILGASPEQVTITGIPDGQHFSAVFARNHKSGEGVSFVSGLDVDFQQLWALGFPGNQLSTTTAPPDLPHWINVADGGSHIELLVRRNVKPLNVVNAPHLMRLCLVLIQDGGGATVEFDNSEPAFKWQGGAPPVLTPPTNNGMRDIFWFYYDQNTDSWYEESRSMGLGP